MEHKLEVRSDLERLFEAIEYCAKVREDGGVNACSCGQCPTGADYKLCDVALNTVCSMLAIGRLGGCKWDE